MESALWLTSAISVSMTILETVPESKLNGQHPNTPVSIEIEQQTELQKEFWKVLMKKSFNAKKLQKFLNFGVDVNSRNAVGETPFLYAVRTHKNRLLEFLLKIPEVKVDAVDYSGNTSVIIAAKYKNIDLIKRLINHTHYGESDVLNFLYAYKNRQRWSDEYLRKCIDNRIKNFLNVSNNRGNTALMTAISCGNYALIRYLVEHGADINKSNMFGLTPLVSAVEKANKKLVKCLVEYNSDDIFSNDIGENLLTLAKEKGLKKVTKILEKAKSLSSLH